ncbi:hypothetical protein BN1723_017229, partial [Verticillium longisporum]
MLSVDLYLGGIEHAILHLLYARFIYKFMASTDLFPRGPDSETNSEAISHEPFKRLITQGMVHGKTYSDPETGKFLKPDEVDLSDASNPKVVATGLTANVSFEKMSKSKHNGVDPTVCIETHGADATRAHMLFQAPVSDVLNWDEDMIAGVTRWLNRLFEHVKGTAAQASSDETAVAYFTDGSSRLDSMTEAELAKWDTEAALWRAVQSTITSVTDSYNKVYPMNTIVSDLMSLTNTLLDSEASSPVVRREATSAILRMLAPITPAFAEECWSLLHPGTRSIF